MNELKIEDLTCYRGENLVLKDLNTKIKSGETLVVRGSNGSGKTTLLRVLSNFIKSYNGKILLNDQNVLEDSNYRYFFNFVGQKNSLKDNLSVKNNLKLWEIIYQKNISYSKLLEDFNMSHLVERDVASLSDGQKKCISLLRLNFTESKIWYLDEPFVFLDEENSQILIQKIKNFNTNNGIVIITSNINLQNTFTNEIKI